MKLYATGWIKTSVLLGVLVLLSACGGGGDSATPTSAPAAPAASLSLGTKQVKLAWPAVSDADHYRVFEDPDGGSGFTQVIPDLTTTSFDHGIALYRRVNARYIVEACNTVGCTSSTILNLSSTLEAKIGYVKASNTGTNDAFGTAVAMSGDGNTLVVGALGEASNATGIGGDQTDNSLTQAGAVYLY